MDFLFHIVSQADWDAFRAAGTYSPASLGNEGFIHLSGLHQVEGTANRHYADHDDLVALVIDPTATGAELRWEDLSGHGTFPHLYGPLSATAVHHSVPLERDHEGSFRLPFDHARGDVAPLAADYGGARRRFLAAAHRAKATVVAHRHPTPGLAGEDLFIDVAVVGDPAARRVLVVVSATHGVEGYAGSALQSHWLEEHAGTRPDEVGVVMIHALNPFGFSWVRRANEDNVDLNRNFVDWDAPLPTNDRYAAMADLLVPADWTPATRQATLEALVELSEDMGLERMQAAVSSGQYTHPGGLFYGGNGPVWSNRWLRVWARHGLAHADDLAVLDLHTGLGPWASCQPIGHHPEGSDGHRRAARRLATVVPMGGERSVSARLTGGWLGAIEGLAPGARSTAVALEFGTVDPITVLEALRADAWLHCHGDPTSGPATAIRAQVRAAFADDDVVWIRSCWPHFARAMTATFDDLGR